MNKSCKNFPRDSCCPRALPTSPPHSGVPRGTPAQPRGVPAHLSAAVELLPVSQSPGWADPSSRALPAVPWGWHCPQGAGGAGLHLLGRASGKTCHPLPAQKCRRNASPSCAARLCPEAVAGLNTNYIFRMPALLFPAPPSILAAGTNPSSTGQPPQPSALSTYLHKPLSLPQLLQGIIRVCVR